MNTLPIIVAVWITLCWIAGIAGFLKRNNSGLSRHGVAIPPSLPARPQTLDDIRARMQTARGQEKAALEEMALDIEANTIDEQGYADWLRSIGENDPDLWRG